jgi:hypothetical protein
VATEVAPTELELAAVAAPKSVREPRPAKPEPIRTRPARGRKTEGDLIVEAVDATIAR